MMTNFLENRTISMILTIPHVKELTRSIDNLDKISQPPSIPIYHGSIIDIEQHDDNENISDLIVRVPNFHHISFPSVSITINDNQFNETENLREIRIKRRAPICPIRKSNNNQTEMKLTNTKRLAIGLRNLRRTIITTCKIKRSTNINEITIIPVLPDVEVIEENLQKPINIKKTSKISSKFHPPKIFFIKRKNFKIKKNQSTSSNSLDNQTNTDDKTHENSLSIKENQPENTNTTIAQLIPNIPISLNMNSESTSTDIIQSNENIEEGLYVVHPNDDTYSECYEITYEIDRNYHQEILQDQSSSIKLNLDPFEYQDLTSTWLPIFSSNNYEQINQSQNDLSQTSNYQSVPENNQLMYMNDPSIINEDYTVIIQFLKRALQLETTSNDEDENALE